MQFQSEILRFQEGARSHHPSPEATIVAARPGMLTDAGERIAVLVDLTPRLTYRSREIRTLTVKTYWASSGSIVARLRRALAAANRHLLHINSDAPPGSKCSGSITCAVFSYEELFLGQVGSAYAFVLHPPGIFPRFEVFPRRERLLVPLGATTPPAINISYTVLEAGCSTFFATTLIAESQSRELWQKTLALPTMPEITQKISQEMLLSQPSGSVILVKGLASNKAEMQLMSANLRRKSDGDKRQTQLKSTQPNEVRESQQLQKQQQSETAQNFVSASMRQITTSVRDSKDGMPTGSTTSQNVTESVTVTAPKSETATLTEPVLPESPVKGKKSSSEQQPKSKRLAFLSLATTRIRKTFSTLKNHITNPDGLLRKRREKNTERETTAERARLRKSLRSLLPGKVDGVRRVTQKAPPAERSTVLGGITAGIAFVVIVISLATYMQFGGPLKAAELLSQASELRITAYNSQKPEDWYQLRDLCAQIVRLDAQNVEALNMKLEAEQAIDALENAAVLQITSLMDLGVSPAPRHIVAADSWVFVLDSSTDDIRSLPLNSDQLTPATSVPSIILKRGQNIDGKQVDNIVDMAWIEPGGIYPDGALFIYADEGTIYIYEPTLGPNSIQSQILQGELSGVAVTGMATFGTKLYFIHRQINQILMYEPINGIYESPRSYFAEETERDLTSVIDMAIDGRIYLLTGEGSLDTYFAGAEDLSFKITDLPNPDSFAPSVLTVETENENGLVYLGDTRRERIVALNKVGEFMHQFRLPGDELKYIEALTVRTNYDEEEDKLLRFLYFIAENKLYAALLPEFLSP